MTVAGALSAGASTLASASVTGLMSSATATVAGLLTAGSATVAGALSAGASTLASASVTGLLTAGSATVSGALSADATTLSSTLGVTGLSTLTGGFTSSASSNMNHNFLIQQSTYPPTTTSALGYSVSGTAAEFTFSEGVIGNAQRATLPSKGVWLVVVNFSMRVTTTISPTIENRQVVVSLANNNMTKIGTLEYFEQLDDAIGANGIRFIETLTGIVTVTTATDIFVNGLFNYTGIVIFTTVYGISTLSATRIG